MTRSRLIGFLGFLFVLEVLHAAGPRITVDESRIRVEFGDTATLTLPVTNSTTQPITTTLHLAFLDRDSKALQELAVPVVIREERTILEADVSGFLQLEQASRPNYGWLRLKYSMPGDAGGIVSLSKIAPEPFILDVISPRNPVLSAPYRVQVLARDPVLGKPVANVGIRGTVASDEEPTEKNLKSARTNASGYAELNFDLSRFPSGSDLEIEVRGNLRKFVRTVSDTSTIDRDFFAVTSMDKPIYQPGEKLRIRTLAFDRMHNALKGTQVQVTIEDPDDDTVFQTSLMTSPYGEAHTEWSIPENARIGNYEIRVGSEGRTSSIDRVWIGRYDLPSVSIDVRQKRPYYVPGETAEVEIRADYLFGKPVPFAAVKVVRQLDRTWNYREMKWDIEEGEVIVGTTDRDGFFETRLSIDDDLAKLSDRRVFADVPYAVFVTDPSTGRTEQRRFWTRVTLFPIHLYIVEAFPGSLPREFYVAASYADGRAAECDVEIFEILDGDRLKREVVRTNSYGVARVRGLWPSASRGSNDELREMQFVASDAAGNAGQTLDYFRTERHTLRLYTDKTLYRQSDPIAVHVESTVPSGQIVVNASIDGRVLHSAAVQLSAGKADVVIPFSSDFRGSVFISAYHSAFTNSLFEGRRVSFPSTGGLEIESSFDKTTYAPGEQATLKLQLRNGNRSSQEGIFGVTVFDKAVEERARADAEFGGRYSTCHTCGFSLRYDPALPTLTVSDVHRVDRRKPIPADLELAAEMLLLRWYRFDDQPRLIADEQSIASAFQSNLVQRRFDALRYSEGRPSGFHLPKDEPSLRAMVLRLDPEFETLRDPWDNGYRLNSSVYFDQNQIEIITSGADEVFGSPDDFRVAVIQWPYFSEFGKAIRSAITQHHQRTGAYIRDLQALKSELGREGYDFEAWRDPQGRPYTAEFGVDRNRFTVNIKTDKRSIWKEGVDYTAELHPRIDAALNQFVMKRGAMPEDDVQLRSILRDAGISEHDLLDPWGNPYYSTVKMESGYFDSITITTDLKEGVKIVPVSRQAQILRLRSAGPDGIEGSSDDFTSFSFLRPISEQSVEQAAPRFVESPFLDASYGAVYVEVMDSSGALIPGVTINLRGPGEREITGITGEEGYSFLRNIDPGMYELRASLPGFRTKVLTGVFVRAGVITRVVATLDVASTATTVEVAISADTLYTTAASSVGEVVTTHGSSALRPTSTPRLREYFPETLLWQPAVEAKGGAAEVRFKLADSMTTWKAVTIASTKDGRIAVDEKEIVAFQPFFLEHDPPKLLTDGDQIALPVVVRSYLDRDQSIELSMKKEEWFEPLGDASRNLNVKAGEFTREVFPFKAIKPVDSGKQRVTALGSAASDAIEKTSTVLPFGREVTQVSSGIFRSRSTHNFTVPGDALPGTVRAQLKIYPNLMAHVADSIEGIMQRPYGCAEQVISSAYPSLLFLNYARQTGRLSDPLAKKAMRYLEIALQSLRGYQSDEGGFSYWTRGEPDVAVTAYALQFLAGAEEFIEFDDDFSYDALHWLTDRQTSDGSWLKDPKLTAYVVSVLSVPGVGPADKNPVTHGLAYLEKLSLQTAEPYLTASTALAALQAGNRQVADTALSSLRSRVRYEKDAAFWNLETNTPFYGWGVPGRVETTALVVRALAAGKADQDLVDKGLLFLMRNKDRYGVWNSTQATVRVLEALVHLVGDGPAPDRPGSANILVNGAPVSAVNFGTRQQPYNPVIVDLSRFLKPGANTVEIVEQKKAGTATIQLVQSHYIPWNRSAGDLASGPLRLSVRFDKQEAAINESITVAVEAERIGFRGYGMMLAEIGLPPGADVDRESLTTAVASSGWDLSRYDVMPDRVIVYVWPRGGGTKFEFKFRPRYGLEAHSPASKLYDYYNPDAYAILPPEHFTVR